MFGRHRHRLCREHAGGERQLSPRRPCSRRGPLPCCSRSRKRPSTVLAVEDWSSETVKFSVPPSVAEALSIEIAGTTTYRVIEVARHVPVPWPSGLCSAPVVWFTNVTYSTVLFSGGARRGGGRDRGCHRPMTDRDLRSPLSGHRNHHRCCPPVKLVAPVIVTEVPAARRCSEWFERAVHVRCLYGHEKIEDRAHTDGIGDRRVAGGIREVHSERLGALNEVVGVGLNRNRGGREHAGGERQRSPRRPCSRRGPLPCCSRSREILLPPSLRWRIGRARR